MSEALINLLIVFGTIALGFLVSFMVLKGRNLINIEKKEREAKTLIEKAKKEAENVLIDVAERVEKRKENLVLVTRTRKSRLENLERSISQREKSLTKRQERNSEIKLKIASYQEGTQSLEENIKSLKKDVIDKLCQTTALSIESLKEEILSRYRLDLERENVESLAVIEEHLKENATKIAKRILVNVMQRLTSVSSVERRSVHIKVPKDHIKGKIVGKGGLNVAHIEQVLDVDVIFNDLPHTISVSAFNLVNRRIAQRTIEILVRERGDISIQTIDRAIKKAEQDTDKELYKIGKGAIEEMRIEIKDAELIRIIGRLQYRTSYGQNIMKHSMEVGWVASMLGAEIGVDIKTCKVGGFLHDLGKAIDQDPNITDPHDLLSKKLMEKFGFSWEEVHAAWTHHDAIPQETPEALLVKAADAVSAGRPGARQESLQKYFERIKALENTGYSFKGVKKTYALSAGRELRIIVDPDKINDKAMTELAKGVVDKIENNLVYPGTIKVNIIRKTEFLASSK